MRPKDDLLPRHLLLAKTLLLSTLLLCSCSAKTNGCVNADKRLLQAYKTARSTNEALEIAVQNPAFLNKNLGFEFGKNSMAFFLEVKMLPIHCRGDALENLEKKEPGLQKEIDRTKKLRALMGIGYNNNEW